MAKAAMLWRQQDLVWKINALMVRKQREWQRLLNRKSQLLSGKSKLLRGK